MCLLLKVFHLQIFLILIEEVMDRLNTLSNFIIQFIKTSYEKITYCVIKTRIFSSEMDYCIFKLVLEKLVLSVNETAFLIYALVRAGSVNVK
jgi:hypothetical protein